MLIRQYLCIAAATGMTLVASSAFANHPGSRDQQEPDVLCIRSAAAYHGVNGDVLKAIIWIESRMRRNAVNINGNGSKDLGAAQINSIHLPRLQRFGITEERLLDGCTSVYVGAWLLAELIAEKGNTWEAVGSYHSRTPRFQHAYANSIAITLASWGKIQKGWLPYPNAARSSAEAQRLARGEPPSTANNRPGLQQTLAQSAIAAFSD